MLNGHASGGGRVVARRKAVARTVSAQDDVLTRRRYNLRAVAAQRGGPTGLAKVLGYEGPSYISQMIGPQHKRPITEKTARHIEQAVGLPTGWLDLDHGHFGDAPSSGARPAAAAPEPQAVPVDEPLFLQVAAVLRPLLQATPLPRDKAHVVFVRVYGEAEKSGTVDADLARDLVRLAS